MEMKHGTVHHATFSIISAQNALEAAIFATENAEYSINTLQLNYTMSS